MRGVEQIPWLYDSIMSLCEWTGLKRWRHWLAEGVRGRVLEVGCGTGRNLALYPAGTQLIAIDPAMDSLRAARRRAPQVPLVRASAEALPFRDTAFDTAVSGLVFCSVPDPGKGLAEVKRVLRPDGELRMLEHVRSSSALTARWQDFIHPAWKWASGGCNNNRETERTVESAGFVIDAANRRERGTMRRFSAHKREAK